MCGWRAEKRKQDLDQRTTIPKLMVLYFTFKAIWCPRRFLSTGVLSHVIMSSGMLVLVSLN